MADIAGVICSALSCICGTPTCKLIDQHGNFNDDVNELRRKLRDLKCRKQDTEVQIQVRDMGRQKVKQEVEEWLKHVQEIDVEVEALLEKVQRNKWCNRACLGKLVCRKLNVVKEMFESGSFPEGPVIERPPAGLLFPTEYLEGEISTKEEIWKHLMDDEVGMIAVFGIGGVGKTTVMKHINNELVEAGRFQKVIWVTVSYPLSVFEVQKKIADAMSETLKEDEVMRRAAELAAIMGRKSFLLILDDVWEKFSLEDIGIPKPMPHNKCKVVITSRSAEVCNYFGCEIVKVQPLSAEESLQLFLRTTGDGVLQVPGLEEILKLIVEECAGLPLAIVVIAGGLKGEGEPNIVEWRNALKELQQRVKSVNGMEEMIYERLRFSYDRLKNLEIQKCFLYCSLFKEDYEFSREQLIEGWIDEGLIDESGKRQDAYDRGNVFLNKLEKNCLLGKTVNMLSEGFKMHDVVRDMAITSIGPGVGYMVKAGRKLTEVPKEHEWFDLNKVSLMANHISEIPVGLTPKCPTLSTFILSDNPLTEIPDSIFEDMSGLKVLDLSRTNIEALPSSISKLKYLSALRLSWCERLKCLPSLETLVALKKLDLRGAGIEVVPQGMKMLVSLEYLDLFCKNLKEIPTGILSKLSSLQYLVAKGDWLSTSVKDDWRSGVKISVEEVARLRKLEILQCNFDGMQDLSYFLSEYKNFRSFIAYELLVGTKRNYNWDVDNPKYKCRLTISGCDIGQECIVLPDKLQHLRIHNCKNIRSSLNRTALLENATELGICIISDCEETKYVVELDSSSSSLCSPVLDKLEGLYLHDLPRLWGLVRVEGVATLPRFFSNLKTLEIVRCLGMRKLLPLELLQTLQNLEVIEVVRCEQMEEIIASSDSDASSSDKFTFPKLRELTLWNLPQLKSICSGKGVMVCDSIEDILIMKCPELKRIPLQLPLHDNGQPSPPPRLREISLDKPSKEWWESVVEWDHPNAKNILQPFLKFGG